jgi:hypothetical protein
MHAEHEKLNAKKDYKHFINFFSPDVHYNIHKLMNQSIIENHKLVNKMKLTHATSQNNNVVRQGYIESTDYRGIFDPTLLELERQKYLHAHRKSAAGLQANAHNNGYVQDVLHHAFSNAYT